MREFEATIKKRKNSLGFIIPDIVIKSEKIKPNKKIIVVIMGNIKE